MHIRVITCKYFCLTVEGSCSNTCTGMVTIATRSGVHCNNKEKVTAYQDKKSMSSYPLLFKIRYYAHAVHAQITVKISYYNMHRNTCVCVCMTMCTVPFPPAMLNPRLVPPCLFSLISIDLSLVLNCAGGGGGEEVCSLMTTGGSSR